MRHWGMPLGPIITVSAPAITGRNPCRHWQDETSINGRPRRDQITEFCHCALADRHQTGRRRARHSATGPPKTTA